MSSQHPVFDTFSFSGDDLDRLRQALKVARHEARVAQNGAYGPHVEDALVEIEEAIGAHLAQIASAVDDDKAEAKDSGEAALERRSWFSHYRAA
jgi:hypothetical protein